MEALSISKLLFLAVITLIIFGPKKLPELARSLGKVLREFQNVSKEFTEEMKLGLNEPELGKPETSSRPTPPKPGPKPR